MARSTDEAAGGAIEVSVPGGSLEAFDALREAYGALFTFDALSREGRRSFAYRSRLRAFGPARIGEFASDGWTCTRDERVIARRRDDSICVAQFLDGRHAIDADGATAVLAPGDILITAADRPLTMRSDAVRKRSIMLSRDLLTPLAGALDDRHGAVLRAGSPMNGLVGAHMAAFAEEAAGLSAPEAAAVTRATAALITAALGPARGEREAAQRGETAALLRAMRRTIEANLQDPALSPETLARRCNLSRAALYRMAQPLGGVSAYIQERRLARARRDLADPAFAHHSVAGIAYRWGFGSPAAFSRAFRARYRMTPSDAREEGLGMGLAAGAAALAANRRDAFASFAGWIEGDVA